MTVIVNRDGAQFRAEAVKAKFYTSIKAESDISTDGGYTFEVVENEFLLDLQCAKALYAELGEFLHPTTHNTEGEQAIKLP